MSLNKFLLFAGLVGVVAPVVYGETHCPGNAASLPLRLVQNTLFVTAVDVNGSGPYDFLVDSGAQVNSIDDSLAAELHLIPEQSVGVSGAATYSRNALAHVDLAAGGKKAEASEIVIVPSSQLRNVDRRIRGILGGTFLEHFDFLLDNQNHILCLDDTGNLAGAVKGQKIALENPLSGETNSVRYTRPLIVSARLTGIEKPTVLLLDSGSNSPLLFSEIGPIQSRLQKTLKRVVNGVGQEFGIIESQEVRIGKTVLHGAQFAVPMNSVGGKAPTRQEDGVMPTYAYRRVFISPSRGYAVLDTWD